MKTNIFHVLQVVRTGWQCHQGEQQVHDDNDDGDDDDDDDNFMKSMMEMIISWW